MTVRGSPDPYSFVTYNTGSYFETDSGATTGTLDEVNDFSDGANSSYADEYTISGPPASTVTDEATSTGTTSGDPRDTSNGTLIPAYWDTYAVGLATSMGTSPLDAPIQDGTTTGEWDTSKNLVSALGGQDMHALQFTGSEVQPAISGSALVLEQGGGGSAIWASHPSAIGYRRQGYVTSGSHGGSGSTTITIAAVAPEFDSGMNIGADQDETERLLNFSQGAEENPTAAQTQPISRAVQQTAVVGPGGEPLFVPNAPTRASVGNSMGVGGYFGDQMLRDWAPVLGFLGILPPGVGGGGGGGGGGVVNAPAQTPNEVSMRMYPVSPGLSPGYTGSGPPPANQPSGNTASPGPGPKSSSNVDPLALLAMLAVLSNGAQINPAQPAPQPDEEADDSLDDEDAVQDACGGDGDGGAGAQGGNEASGPGPLLTRIKQTQGMSANISTKKTMAAELAPGGGTIIYSTEWATTVTSSFTGDKNHVSINFNTKATSRFSMLPGEPAPSLTPGAFSSVSPSWTPAQRQQVVQAVRGAIERIENALAILSDPAALKAFLQVKGVGINANKLRDPQFLRKMLQNLVNVKQGLENGTINIFIDTTYKSPRQPLLNTRETSYPWPKSMLIAPYYAANEPIHVSPLFFTSRPDVQAVAMTHELARYFGGIIAGNEGETELTVFDTIVRVLLEYTQWLRRTSSRK